ncbi:Tyrosine-protein phosphatase DSP1 [Apiospora rasikravindrae]|uniref:diphosphoinositol-polyphosphate diphosphatase n=1 Tax=Apiospora rasikravindrae TaxID=990691 RepID=A0ABR1SWU2_9PEZI
MSEIRDLQPLACAKVPSLEPIISDHQLAIAPMATSQLCSQAIDAKEVLETTDVSLRQKNTIKIANRHVTCQVQTPPATESISISRALSSAVPLPLNFGCVIPGVFRSSYPQAQDLAYLRKLKLKTIVTLVQKDLPEGFQEFIDSNGITHKIFDMVGTKKAEIPLGLMRSIMEIIADRRYHPLLIHCNHGKHRTGCVVGVYRKWSGWDTASVVAEYHKYASPKARDSDVKYLNEFKLTSLKHVMTEKQPYGIRQFSFLTMVAAISLVVWILTFYSSSHKQLST